MSDAPDQTTNPGRSDVGTTALVAEDDRLLRDLAAVMLREAGFTVLQAASGEAAMGLLGAGHRIGLLVTDIQMGGEIDGWALAEYARERDAGLRVVYTTSGRCEPARQVPRSAFVQKPYQLAALLDAVQATAQAA